MIKKTITYENYNGETVSEDFYFNMTKLELAETDLELGGFEETIAEISKSDNAKKAFGLFKDLVLASVGVKSDDGKRFIKSEQIRQEFAESPACGELIFEFLSDVNKAIEWIQGLVPGSMITEEVEQKLSELREPTPELNAAAPELEPVAPPTDEKRFEDYSRQELLEMPKEQFEKLLPSKPGNMTQDQLQVAMQRRSQQ